MKFTQNKNNAAVLSELPGDSLMWDIFGLLSETPRPSHYFDKIVPRLVKLGEELGFEAKEVEGHNVVITKKADAGFEHLPTVVLQGHSDMVAEMSEKAGAFDFKNDALKLRVVDGWLMATETTLGSDDGIATAMALSYMKNNKTGKIELLITSNEEVGLDGARAVKPGMVSGKYLINIDSEEANEICVGCAGGLSFEMTYDLKTEANTQKARHIFIRDGSGGHSGTQIHQYRLNSLKVMGEMMLAMIEKDPEMVLCNIKGGNLFNAIPRDGFMDVLCSEQAFQAGLEVYQQIKIEQADIDPKFNIEITDVDAPTRFTKCTRDAIVNLINAWQHGVLRIDSHGNTETSNNLASIVCADGQAKMVCSARSFYDAALFRFYRRAQNMCAANGWTCHPHFGFYSGWQPDYNSTLLKLTKQAYLETFKKEPRVYSVHAGLECAVIMANDSSIKESVSIGPTILGAHSPSERMHIEETVETYEALCKLMELFYANKFE